jgi:hypothetical protein
MLYELSKFIKSTLVGYISVIVGEQAGSDTGAIALVQVSVTVNVDSVHAGSIQDDSLSHAGYKLMKC